MAKVLHICPLCGARITCENDGEHLCLADLRNEEDDDPEENFYWGTFNFNIKN